MSRPHSLIVVAGDGHAANECPVELVDPSSPKNGAGDQAPVHPFSDRAPLDSNRVGSDNDERQMGRVRYVNRNLLSPADLDLARRDDPVLPARKLPEPVQDVIHAVACGILFHSGTYSQTRLKPTPCLMT